jgi:dipeptidyl aminopeptidase/acylaminoacyl peptidase
MDIARRLLSVAGLLVVFARAGGASPPLSSAATAQGSRPFRFEDLKSVLRPSDVQLSPDGRKIAYVVQHVEKATYGDRSEIWLADVASGENAPLTSGKDDRMPRWSPDGRTIAFLSSRGGDSEVWRIRLSGGEARPVRETPPPEDWKPGSVSDLAWSPDGSRLVIVARAAPDEKKAAEKKPSEPPATLVASQAPEMLTQNERTESFLATIDVKTGRCERLTDGKLVPSSPGWSPDSTEIVFIGKPIDALVGNADNASDVYSVSLASKDARKIGGQKLSDYSPAWSPSGDAIVYVSDDGPTVYEALRSLHVVDKRTGKERLISGDFKKASTRLPARWAADGRIYFSANDHATLRIMSVDPNGSGLRRVTPEDMYVRSYSFSPDGKTMAALFENAGVPPDLYVGSPQTGKFRKLTDMHVYLRNIAMGSVERVKWRSADDRFTVEGFLVKPPGFEAGKRYPLLVNVHGGPGSAYSNAFAEVNFESGYHSPAQLYAAEGYLVLLPNPRGDYSYSKEYTDAFIKDWGKGDFNNDVNAGVDFLVKTGVADPERLGIMGHSYGGYSTAWAITQTDRFKAASLSDSPLNLVSSYGQLYPDFIEFYDYFLGGDPYRDATLFLDRSPVTHASKIKTPLMIRVGNKPHDVKPSGMLAQGLELYAALKQKGVPVELVVNPREGHGIMDLDTYRDYVERNIRWFNFWVLGKGSDPLRPPEGGSGR